MPTMISKLRRSSRAVAVAVAATALVVGTGAGATAAADRALPLMSVSDTGWDFTADRLGLSDQVASTSAGDTGWD